MATSKQYFQIFIDFYTKEFPCMVKSHKGANFAFCSVCGCDLNISHGGINDLKRPFLCAYDDCNKSFVRAAHLKRHELIHESSNVRCSYKDCDTIFKTAANLKRHIDNIHLKKKPKLYKCSQCDQEFNKHTLLKTHEYKHNNIKPYACSKENCGKSFPTPSKLKRHEKIHEGYTCCYSSCNVVSQTWSLYLKHMSVDHPTIYYCSVCSKTFNSKGNLRSHEATHLSPDERVILCCPAPKCEKSYYEMKNLKHHYNTIHKDHPFKCGDPSCSLSFKDEDKLKKHFEKAHDPNVPLSSKKRKLKAKRKKAKLSLAAKLAGFTTEPEDVMCKKGLDALRVATKVPRRDDPLAADNQSLPDFVAPNSKAPVTQLKRPIIIEISITKADDKAIYKVTEENYTKPTDDDSIEKQSPINFPEDTQNSCSDKANNSNNATMSKTDILCC